MRSCFPGYIHHELSTTSKIFHIYVLSESACNLGCIRHLEDSNQILSATCLGRLLPLVLPQLPKQLTLVGTTQQCALPPPATAHCRGVYSAPTHAHLEINAPEQTAAGGYSCLPTSPNGPSCIAAAFPENDLMTSSSQVPQTPKVGSLIMYPHNYASTFLASFPFSSFLIPRDRTSP